MYWLRFYPAGRKLSRAIGVVPINRLLIFNVCRDPPGFIPALLSWGTNGQTEQYERPEAMSLKSTETKLTTITMLRDGNSERGFSLVELMVVLIIVLIIAAGTILQLRASLQSTQADTAMREVMEQLRQAREYAVANRRYVQVTFPVVVVGTRTDYHVVITQMNTLTVGAGAVDTVLSDVTLEPQLQYFVVPGYPDTPDGFGNASPIVFGGVNGGPIGGMLFQSDGELVSGATFLPINGSVFLGVPLQSSTARAVTVLGTTGRVRGWKPTGAQWVQF